MAGRDFAVSKGDGATSNNVIQISPPLMRSKFDIHVVFRYTVYNSSPTNFKAFIFCNLISNFPMLLERLLYFFSLEEMHLYKINKKQINVVEGKFLSKKC
jgi:hypothetical protein